MKTQKVVSDKRIEDIPPKKMFWLLKNKFGLYVDEKNQNKDYMANKLKEQAQKFNISSIHSLMKSMFEKPKESAKKRLMRDLKEVYSNPLPTIDAVPLKNNIFEWHCNLLAPRESKYWGICLHIVLIFPHDYPMNPPKAKLKTNLNHSHVFGEWICLDLLRTHQAEEKYFGWSSCYTVHTILLQLQSFLFEEEEKMRNGEIIKDIEGSWRSKCTCGHNMPNKPFPWPKRFSEQYEMEHHDESKLSFPKKISQKESDEKRRIKKILKKKISEEEKNENYKKLETEIKNLERARDYCGTKDKSRKRITRKLRGLRRKLKVQKLKVIEIRKENFKKKEKEKQEKLKKERQELIEKEKNRMQELKEKFKFEIICFDALTIIFSFLSDKEIHTASKVCIFWNKASKHPLFHSRRELVCFFSKKNFLEEILGFGINVKHSNSTGKILTVTTTMDIISREAFFSNHVRKGAWNEEFQYFLPMFITESHWRKARQYFENLVCSLYKLEEFDVVYAIDLLAKLMNSLVVVIMSDEMHASERAITAYGYFHRCLLHYYEKNKKLKKKVNYVVKQFINAFSYRHKSRISSIGEFLPIVMLSDYSHKDILEALLEEVGQRNCFWIKVKTRLNLYFCKDDPKEILPYVFDSIFVSTTLLAFQLGFIECLYNPETMKKDNQKIMNLYDMNFGCPSEKMKKFLQDKIFAIKKIETFQDFYKYVGSRHANKNNFQVFGLLKRNWNYAYKKKYFTKIDTTGPIIKPLHKQKWKKKK